MPTSLFLFGTDHRLQCGGRDCTPEQSGVFSNEIRGVCHLYKIRRIAEEMSTDGLRNYEVDQTNIEKVAFELNLPYQQVDLNALERQALSMTDATLLNGIQSFRQRDGGTTLRGSIDAIADEIRERIWALRILEKKPWPVLFVIGANHVKTFRKVWHRLGTDAAIVYEDYEA